MNDLFKIFENSCKIIKYFAKLKQICKKNKKSLVLHRLFSFLMHLSYKNLVLDDSVVRASTSAGAATNALIRVNNVDAAF